MKKKTNSRTLSLLLEIMAMVWMLKRFLLAVLVATGGFDLLVDAQDQKGFISLDCGLPQGNTEYVEEDTGLVFVSDAPFIDTGESKFISLQYTQDYSRRFESLRSFPDGIRNCYRINVTSGNPYLIRASFLYGDYDGKDTLPEFDVHIGANFWDTVNVTDAGESTYREVMHVPPRNHIHVCLVRTGSSFPFISSLLIRRLTNQCYETGKGSLAGLALSYRVDTGTTTPDQVYRYPEDVYDRIWPSAVPNSDWTSLKTSQTIDSSSDDPCKPPSVVISTAATPKNPQDSLDFDLSTGADDDDTSEYYVYMHFAELEPLKADQRRIFNISHNEESWAGPYAPLYLETETFYSPSGLIGGHHRFSIYAVDNSTHPPILNAYEVYMVKRFLQSEANQNDTDAVTILKSTYWIKRNWQGDPCTREYLWEGLNCSYDGNYDAPRIISLNLSSSVLTGEIPPSISELTMIQNVDLSNNNFTGSVPEFLSKLPNLKVLNLEKNSLKGPVPVALVEKWRQGMLSLSVCGNQDLIGPVSCNSTTKEKKKENSNLLVISIAASVGIFVLLLTVAAVWWGHRSKKQNNQKGSLTSSKQEFTYSEILRITNNFERVIGEGGFGAVYHGYVGDSQVAVKMLSPSAVQGHQQYLAEVNLLIGVHHKNLTKLIGYCNDEANTGLIYEYMANGNLKAHISDHNPFILKWEVRLQIALDVAQGLEYLHYGCNPPIIHRDVKLTNILLNENLRAKISDFGLSKIFSADSITISHLSTVVAGTPGYLDPEYTKSNRLNEKSDVYSFGVVLLEIITGRSAIDKSHNNIHVSDWVTSTLENGDLNSIVDPRLDGIFDINSAWKAVELAINCVSPKPSQRPTMGQVVSELKECLDKGLAWTKGSRDIELTETRPLYSITESSPSAR